MGPKCYVVTPIHRALDGGHLEAQTRSFRPSGVGYQVGVMRLPPLARPGPSPGLFAWVDSSQMQVRGTWSFTHLKPKAACRAQPLRKWGSGAPCRPRSDLRRAQPAQPDTAALEGKGIGDFRDQGRPRGSARLPDSGPGGRRWVLPSHRAKWTREPAQSPAYTHTSKETDLRAALFKNFPHKLNHGHCGDVRKCSDYPIYYIFLCISVAPLFLQFPLDTWGNCEQMEHRYGRSKSKRVTHTHPGRNSPPQTCHKVMFNVQPGFQVLLGTSGNIFLTKWYPQSDTGKRYTGLSIKRYLVRGEKKKQI